MESLRRYFAFSLLSPHYHHHLRESLVRLRCLAGRIRFGVISFLLAVLGNHQIQLDQHRGIVSRDTHPFKIGLHFRFRLKHMLN